MKKIILIISFLSCFYSVAFAQVDDMSYAYRRSTVYLALDSTTHRADTSSSIPIYNAAGRLCVYVKMDTVFKNGGDIPSVCLTIQFADSVSLWSKRYMSSIRTTANDTIIDTLKVNTRTYIDITSKRVSCKYMRIIAAYRATNQKDTTRFTIGVIEE
jgi:hypothetical protein